MQQTALHKIKIIALAEAGIALIGMFLAWTIEKYPMQANNQMGQFGQFDQGQVQMANMMTSTTQNGFNSWGWLALIGILVVVLATLLMGYRPYDYDKNSRLVVIGGFVLIVAGALIYFLVLNSQGSKYEELARQRGITYSASSGIGLWSTLVAGLLGLAWVSGIFNKLNMSPAANQQGYPQHPPYPQQPPYPPQQQPYPPQYYQQHPQQQPPPPPYPPQQQQGPYPQQGQPQQPQQPPYPQNQPQQPPYQPNQQQQPPYQQNQQQQPPYQTPPPPPPPPGNPYI